MIRKEDGGRIRKMREGLGRKEGRKGGRKKNVGK